MAFCFDSTLASFKNFQTWHWHPVNSFQTTCKMNSENETCKRVQSFLRTKFQVSSVPLPWIEGCVTWFRNIHTNNANIQELFDFVSQQWLLADFQHLKIRSLPPNLKNSAVLKLDENYLLQVRRSRFLSCLP